MIRISFFKNKENEIYGFEFEGHAGYASYGKDIVCASVSVLVFNTINSIERFTENDFVLEKNDEKGRIYFKLKDSPDDSCELLLKSLELGICEIHREYGKKFIKIENQEV